MMSKNLIFSRYKLEEEDQAPSDPNSRSGNDDYDAVDGVSSALSEVSAV